MLQHVLLVMSGRLHGDGTQSERATVSDPRSALEQPAQGHGRWKTVGLT